MAKHYDSLSYKRLHALFYPSGECVLANTIKSNEAKHVANQWKNKLPINGIGNLPLDV